MVVPGSMRASTGLHWIFPVVVLAGAAVCAPGLAEAQGFGGPGMARHGAGPGSFGPNRAGPGRSGPGRFGPNGFGPGRFGPRGFGPAGFPSSRLGPARLGPARLGPARYWPSPYYHPWPYYRPGFARGPYWGGGYDYDAWNGGYPFVAGIAAGATILSDHPYYQPDVCYRAIRPVMEMGRWVRRWVTVCHDD